MHDLMSIFIKFHKVSGRLFSSFFMSLWVTFMPSLLSTLQNLVFPPWNTLIPNSINKIFGPIIDTRGKSLLTDLQLDFVPADYYFWILITISPEVSS